MQNENDYLTHNIHVTGFGQSNAGTGYLPRSRLSKNYSDKYTNATTILIKYYIEMVFHLVPKTKKVILLIYFQYCCHHVCRHFIKFYHLQKWLFILAHC